MRPKSPAPRQSLWLALFASCGLVGVVAFGPPADGKADDVERPQLVVDDPAPAPAADPAPAGQGLVGVIPAEAPEGLTFEDFEALPPKWQAWGEATANSITKLYEDDGLDVVGQRAQLADLRSRLNTIDLALGDPAYGAIRLPLLSLHGRLLRRVVLAEAVLDALEADPSSRGTLTSLMQAIEDYEAANTAAAAAAVRSVATELDAQPYGGPIRGILLEHYLNYNVRITAGEQLFRSFVAECRLQNKPVRDCFMATSIRGSSTTNTSIDFDLRPNPYMAEFEIAAQGDIHTRTTGFNKRATLYTSGNHHFLARKQIRFDGRQFMATNATIDVDANNHTYAARTKVSKLPIIGKIADKIALKKARENRGRSEAHSAMRIREQVTPEFQQETDNSLAETNHDLNADLNPRLLKLGLYPEEFRYRTTDTTFHADYRVVAPGELSGGLPIEAPIPAHGLVLRVHEGYVNNLLDRLGIAGKTMTETELRAHFAAFFSDLSGRTIEPEPVGDGDESQFIFAEQDPLRVKIEDGQLIVTIRTGLKREGEEDIPVQEITVPLTYTLEGDHILVTRGQVQVSARGGIGVAAVLRSRIEKSIEPERTRDGWFDVDKDNGEKMRLWTRGLDLVDGWLLLTMEK